MNLGIRSRLFLLSLALIGMALAAAELYLSQTLQAQLIEGIRSDLIVRARLVAQRVADAPVPFSDAQFYDTVADDAARAGGVRITLVRTDGTVAGDSEVEAGALAQLENHQSRAEIASALTNGEGWSVRYSATIHERLMYVAVPIVRRGETLGSARVAMALTRIDDALDNLHRTLATAAILALVIAGVVSWLAAQLVSRKLRGLTGAARRMAGGDLALRTRVAGRDEIAALGAALDQLAESLSANLSTLRGERDLLGGILASMSEGVLVVDHEGRIVLTNPALKAMLLIHGDPVGKSVLHVIRNADLNDLLKRSGEAAPREMELELAGLRPRRVLVRTAVLPGQPGGTLAVFVDVTDLRRLEAVRRDFVSNASHELRSPLTAVSAAAETLEEVKHDPHEASRFIALIARNAERLRSLIDDMLELSRIEARELELHLEPVNISDVVERVLSEHAHRAELKRISLVNHTRNAPHIRADRRALEHVLGNLVDNAVKYCAEGAEVKASARAEHGQVLVRVADTGPGIAPEHLPRLFERFYRVDPGRSRELGGTGLGLAIVKHLVEAMGGAVAVESQPGAGTTFSFTLPQA